MVLKAEHFHACTPIRSRQKSSLKKPVESVRVIEEDTKNIVAIEFRHK